MKVSEFLSYLRRPSLQRLCRVRSLLSGGTNSKILERLARSYRGRFCLVLDDLRKEDLVTIAQSIDPPLVLPPRWRQLPVDKLRKLLCASVAGSSKGINFYEESPDSTLQNLTTNIQLYSTSAGGLATPDVNRLDLSKLSAEARDAERTTVISAYYVESVIDNLLGGCKGEIRLIVNGLGGRRLDAQVKKLKSMQAWFLEAGADVEIRLGFSQGVFHTKLYLFENNDSVAAWIGSANATRAGFFGHNEEVLLWVSPPSRAIMSYVQSAWDTSCKLDECQSKVNSLTAFYRTGTLYYKPYAQLQKTCNPFLNLMNDLPAQEKEKILAFDSEFAEKEVGIGPFSLELAYRQDPDPYHSSGNEVALLDSTPRMEGRLDFRQYAVETCYGYWVSEKFVDRVDCLLELACQQKSRELQRWHEWMTYRQEFIIDAYAAYLNKARRTMDDHEVNWREYTNGNEFVDTAPIENRIAHLTAELGDEKRFKRHCQPYVPSEMPELWEDNEAIAAFETSFFDWLAATASRPRRPKTAIAILDSIRALDLTAEAIRSRLTERLADPDWYEQVYGAFIAKRFG